MNRLRQRLMDLMWAAWHRGDQHAFNIFLLELCMVDWHATVLLAERICEASRYGK